MSTSEWRRIGSWQATALYAGLSLGLAWLTAMPLWLRYSSQIRSETPAAQGILLSQPTEAALAVQLTAVVMMATPLLAAVATLVLVHRVPLRSVPALLGCALPDHERLGLRCPPQPVRRVIAGALAGIGSVTAFVCVSIPVAVLLGGLELDLVGFSGFAALLGDSASEAPLGILVLIQFAMIPVAAVIPNGLLAFGEEAGWRGYLVPALWERGVTVTLLLSGLLWGLWHAPLILLGYNFGTFGLSGVVAMMAGCVCVGSLLTWVRVWSGSIWPVAVTHGALNAAAGMGPLLASRQPPEMLIASPLGVSGWVIGVPLAVLIGLYLRTCRTGRSVRPGHVTGCP